MKKHYSILAFLLACIIQVNAEIHIVTQQGTSFSPAAINVEVGDIVRWEWTAGTHTTTSLVVPVGAASWDSPLTMDNPFFEYTVEVAGEYGYKCTPHFNMGMVGGFLASAASSVQDVVANITLMNAVVQQNNLKINLSLSQANSTIVRLVDLAGHEVATILNKRTSEGETILTLDVSSFGRGIYFVQCLSGNQNLVRKVIIS